MINTPDLAIMRRNSETADEVKRILELPHDRWTQVQIEFGTEEPAVVKVDLILTGQQLKDLADLAVRSWAPEPPFVPFSELPEEDQDRLVQEAIEASREKE